MKIHLVTSNEPLKDGEDITANCGSKVPKAALKYWFDLSEEDAAFLNSLKTCRGCYATKTKRGRYLSGVVSGQEAMMEVA